MKAKLLLVLLFLSTPSDATDPVAADEAELLILEDQIIDKFCELVIQDDPITRKRIWRELLDLFCLQHELSRIIDDSRIEKNLKK